MSNQNDEALARSAGHGDRAAFETLLERHYDRMLRVTTRITGSHAEGQDVTQDVCIRLARTLTSFDGRARFTTWLYRVTVNAARDALRAQAARRRGEAAFAEQAAEAAGDARARADEAAWASEALAQLDPDLRATAVLVVGEGLRHREAGTVLGVSESTVSWRMHQIRRQLAKRWHEEAVA